MLVYLLMRSWRCGHWRGKYTPHHVPLINTFIEGDFEVDLKSNILEAEGIDFPKEFTCSYHPFNISFITTMLLYLATLEFREGRRLLCRCRGLGDADHLSPELRQHASFLGARFPRYFDPFAPIHYHLSPKSW